MKKLILLGLFVLGLSLTSFSNDNKDEELVPFTYPIITVLCANGHFFSYYDLPAYTAADHQDIYNAGCN